MLDASGNQLKLVVAPSATRPSLGALRVYRAEIIKTVESFGASNVRVFGSVALGDARIDSDIDLLIDVPPGTGLITVERVAAAIEDAIPWHVDVVTSGRPRADGAHSRRSCVAVNDDACGSQIVRDKVGTWVRCNRDSVSRTLNSTPADDRCEPKEAPCSVTRPL